MLRLGFVLLLVSWGSTCVQAHPEPKGILDGVIEKVIENLRPQLVNLVLPDIDTDINATGVDVHLSTNNITTSGLDLFTIEELKTTLLPIRLDVLSLHWDEITLIGPYSLNGVIDIDQLQGPLQLDALGNASIIVRDLNFTVGATFRTEEGHLQVKEVILLTARLGQSVVELENIFDGGELDLVINVFLSFFLPDFVNDQGDAVLLALEPVLIEEINKVLAEIDFP